MKPLQPSERYKVWLSDIFQSIQLIEEFIAGMDFPDFEKDHRTEAAVERHIMIISEAASKLHRKGANFCPEIPWHNIRGIGNWLRHEYGAISIAEIWDVATKGLPPLKRCVESTLATFS